MLNKTEIEKILTEPENHFSEDLIPSILILIEDYGENADEDYYKFLFTRIEEPDIREKIASQINPNIFF